MAGSANKTGDGIMLHLLRSFAADRYRVTAIEYGLIAGLIAVPQNTGSCLMRTMLIQFARNEAGVTAIEYALIAALVVLGIISFVTLIGTTISNKFYGPLTGSF